MHISLKRKSISVAIVLTLITFTANAQMSNDTKPYNFYLDLSTGIDNHSGILGIGAFIPFNEQIGLRIGAGIGGWGGKLSAGLKFQDLTQSGFGFGIGYSLCTGLSDFDLTLQDSNGDSRTVNMTFNKVGSLNFTINKNWKLREGMLLYIESGYAVPTGGNDPYMVNDGTVLNSDEKLILNILRPGGLIISLGLTIGI